MKPSHIYAVHPAGYLVKFVLEEDDHLADAVETLVEREYRPSHGDAWPRTPEGLPICPKNGEVMTQREKQGDTWYSHRVTDEQGEVLYCRGYPGKSSPGWGVPAPKREKGAGEQGGKGAGETRGRTDQRRPIPPPPPDEPATQPPLVGGEDSAQGLPDYRALALAAKTATEFDYAAYMALRNGMYSEVGRITATRESVASGWKPSVKSNGALLVALEVYRDKRQAAEGRGEAAGAAHQFAKKEAMGAYNKTIG